MMESLMGPSSKVPAVCDVDTKDGEPAVVVGGEVFSSSEVFNAILNDLKITAEGKTGATSLMPMATSISLPNFLQEKQLLSVLNVCEGAGLNLVSTPSDAVAAVMGAVHSNLMPVLAPGALAAVIDFGGRHVQVAVVKGAAEASGEPLLVGHSTRFDMGAEQIDASIVEKLCAEFVSKNKIDIRNDGMAMQRLFDAAEASKIELSVKLVSEINLPFLSADAKGPKHLNMTLKRGQLDSMVEEACSDLEQTITQTLTAAGVANGVAGVQIVVLVGGGARIPKVKEVISNMFKVPEDNLVTGDVPEELVVIGAAAFCRATGAAK